MNKITFAFKNIMNQRIGRLEEKWNYDSGALLLSSPVIDDIDGDGKKEIIFGTKNGKIFSIDIEGKLKWSFSVQEMHSEVELMFLDTESSDSIHSSPNIEDINNDGKKEVVFGTEAGKLYVLDSKGALVWSFQAEGPIRGTPAVQKFANNEVGIIFGSSDKNLYFLNSKGKQYWVYAADSEIESCPTLIIAKQPMILFGTNKGTLIALNLKGQLLWKFETKGKILAQPVYDQLIENSNPVIIIGSTDGKLYCLNESGELVWSFETDGAICSRVNIADVNNDKKKEIIFGSCDNCIYSLDYTGKKLWSYEKSYYFDYSDMTSASAHQIHKEQTCTRQEGVHSCMHACLCVCDSCVRVCAQAQTIAEFRALKSDEE
jgi:outer membrane protein assembly factor BamB